MSKIRGKDVRLLLAGQQVAGAKTANISITTVMTTDRTKDDDRPGKEPDHIEWNANSSCVLGKEGDSLTEFQIDEMKKEVLTGTTLEFKFNIGSMAGYKGSCKMTQFDVNAPTEGKITCSITVEGIGTLTKEERA